MNKRKENSPKVDLKMINNKNFFGSLIRLPDIQFNHLTIMCQQRSTYYLQSMTINRYHTNISSVLV